METFLDGLITLHCGDCMEILKGIESNSLDSAVMDPPYHLTSIVKRFGGNQAPAKDGQTGAYKRASAGFMGKQWDGGDIAFRPDVWREVYRVLKPGAYLLAFASSRGIWRMGVAIEDAGFIAHPMIGWVFGSGFPKATKIRAEGYEDFRYGGQSLKPAIEPIFMGQKPFEKGFSGTKNILKHGTGAVNIEECRVHGADAQGGAYETKRMAPGATQIKTGQTKSSDGQVFSGSTPPGRWPANLIHDGSEEVLAAFPDAAGQQRAVGPEHGEKSAINCYGDYGAREHTPPRNDSGSAARFFYCAKANKYDRAASRHPTVKPIKLMRYLVRLVTPPGGTVLDCFAGTGTTAEAAVSEGMKAVLCESEAEHQDEIRQRIKLYQMEPEARKREIDRLKALEKAEGEVA